MREAVPSLYVVVPVYNEEGNIPRLIANMRSLREAVKAEFDVRLVFVDDGSTDGTVSSIESLGRDMPVLILQHGNNRGPGAAFATGFMHLVPRLMQDDWVVTMEGDNTSRPDVLMQMLRRRLEGYEVVLASPYAYGGGFSNTPWHRVLLSHAANGLAKLLLGIRGIHTLSCFFRLYNDVVLKRLAGRYGNGIIEFAGFECMLELVCKLVNVSATMSEVPLRVDTRARAGKSKMKIVRTIKGYLRVFVRSREWQSLCHTSGVEAL